MAASRWNQIANDLIEWIEEDQKTMEEYLILSGQIADNPVNLSEESKLNSPEDERLSKLPEELPILPLRGVVVYPETTVPLTIGQPRSIRLVDDIIAGDRLIGLVTSKDSEIENPGPEDLYQIGTIAVVNRLFRAPDGTIRLLMQGIARFKTEEFTQL